MNATDEAYTVRTLTPLRKVIATRMTEVVRTIPHFRVTAEIAVDALIETRDALQKQLPDARLSLTDLLLKACATALMDVPAVNSQWVDGSIHEYCCADLSVVTAIDGGLTTPIVRRADQKSVAEISAEVSDLVARARRNALRMDEVFGGSFSLSNLGMYGVDEFDAIINPPQCAILAVGRAQRRYVVDQADRPTIATVLRATLSVDHRALDGAIAALFMATLRRRVEQPDYMLLPAKSAA